MGINVGGGNIVVTGSIACDARDVDVLLAALPDHIRLSRAESGNLAFDIVQSPDDACRFLVSERFVDRAAFDAHSKRTRASKWWSDTNHIGRDLDIVEA